VAVTLALGGGEIAGFYSDATGTHGFIYAGGAFSTVDVAGARKIVYGKPLAAIRVRPPPRTQ
jgi:hypothetical protein